MTWTVWAMAVSWVTCLWLVFSGNRTVKSDTLGIVVLSMMAAAIFVSGYRNGAERVARQPRTSVAVGEGCPPPRPIDTANDWFEFDLIVVKNSDKRCVVVVGRTK